MPDPKLLTELAVLTAAAHRAGEIALKHFGTKVSVTEKPGGAGPVTEADLEVDDALRSDLMHAFPDYGWLSEESEDRTKDRLVTPRQIIVDPIDGTRAFLEGAKDWCHALASVDQSGVRTAVVFMPARNLLFTATRGGGAYVGSERLEVSQTNGLEESSVLGAKTNFDPSRWKGNVAPPVKRAFRSSLAYRLALVAQGRFEAMLTLRPSWEWDVAAGCLLVTEAGGQVSDMSGRTPRFNNVVPQIEGLVAGGSIQKQLVNLLA